MRSSHQVQGRPNVHLLQKVNMNLGFGPDRAHVGHHGLDPVEVLLTHSFQEALSCSGVTSCDPGRFVFFFPFATMLHTP